MISGTRDTFKRLIKLVISSAFFVASACWTVIRRLPNTTCVVLYYHAVPCEHRKRFARQMDILARSTKPVEAGMKSPPPKGGHYAAVTFDDGYESVIENALPELEQRRLHSTLFIVTGVIGGFPTWLDRRSAGHGPQQRIISADQLRKLTSHLVTIGSHSMTHPHLPFLTEEQARQELVASRERLEKLLNREVTLFSFPYGAFNEKLVSWCAEAGYERAFTCSPVFAFTHEQEFLTGRVGAEPTDWRLEFRLKLLGAYRWLPLAFALKRKVLSLFMATRILRMREHSVVPHVTRG